MHGHSLLANKFVRHVYEWEWRHIKMHDQNYRRARPGVGRENAPKLRHELFISKPVLRVESVRQALPYAIDERLPRQGHLHLVPELFDKLFAPDNVF